MCETSRHIIETRNSRSKSKLETVISRHAERHCSAIEACISRLSVQCVDSRLRYRHMCPGVCFELFKFMLFFFVSSGQSGAGSRNLNKDRHRVECTIPASAEPGAADTQSHTSESLIQHLIGPISPHRPAGCTISAPAPGTFDVCSAQSVAGPSGASVQTQ